jgi:hypothetical protein
MANLLRSRIIAGWFLAILAAGCGQSPTVLVETTVHPDGSCDRMIKQPTDMFLPEEAFTPQWNARWKTVSDPRRQPASPGFSISDGMHFTARGTFKNPGEIPPHYRYRNQKAPDAGVSELVRTYERNDYGFVVEHRWREKITNFGSLPEFMKARDELLDQCLPLCAEWIEHVLGKDFDVSRLITFLRTDVRRFLENASVIVYHEMVRYQQIGEDRKLDDTLVTPLLDEAERIGLDRKSLTVMFKNPHKQEELERTWKPFYERLAVQYLRHRDGTAVTAAEAGALVEGIAKNHRYEAEAQAETNRLAKRLNGDKQFEKRINRALVGMLGLYELFLFFAPKYDFTVRLPGELVETNGTRIKAGQTRWKFSVGDLFPGGFEMRARSLFIDRDAQKKLLGRVVIDDETQAMEFMELTGADGSLVEAVRKVHSTGDRNVLTAFKARSYQEGVRARKLQDMLFKP